MAATNDLWDAMQKTKRNEISLTAGERIEAGAFVSIDSTGKVINAIKKRADDEVNDAKT